MIVIVAGSRSICEEQPPTAPLILRRHKLSTGTVASVLDAVVESGFPVTRLISGGAGGADTAVLLKPWACEVITIPAQWERYGRRAGFLRNQEMIDQGARALVAYWDGKSNGTRDMIDKARKAQLEVFVRLPTAFFRM